MTYYKRYSEEQRNDIELRKAVQQELFDQYHLLDEAKAALESVLTLLNSAQDIEEDSLDQSSGLIESRVAVRAAISKFNYKIARPASETYIGNVAAAMSPDKAEALKAKYRRNIT